MSISVFRDLKSETLEQTLQQFIVASQAASAENQAATAANQSAIATNQAAIQEKTRLKSAMNSVQLEFMGARGEEIRADPMSESRCKMVAIGEQLMAAFREWREEIKEWREEIEAEAEAPTKEPSQEIDSNPQIIDEFGKQEQFYESSESVGEEAQEPSQEIELNSQFSKVSTLHKSSMNAQHPVRVSYPMSSNVGVRDGDGNCRFKGVIPQNNGNYGAQIYANQIRVWLGTFKTERDAAMAYDSASIRLRSNDSFRNISSDPETLSLEAEFQGRYTTEEVLDMIKDGFYQSMLVEFRRTCELQVNTQQRSESYSGNIKCTKLFEKELTTSDVGKLNRLVIPKKYAMQFLPRLRETTKKSPIDQETELSLLDEKRPMDNEKVEDQETELSFLDGKMKCWKFRYCYWKSSQSYVFTRGWNKFVKDNNLQAKDAVVFYECQTIEQGSKFFKIDVRYKPITVEVEVEQPPELVGGVKKRIRLFGVDITCDCEG